MRFLIAGVGSVGRRHLDNLLALGERDVILLRTGRGGTPAGGGSFKVEADLHAALAHEPHAVIVSNPSALHMDVAIVAARAGCHLLIEKPVSHTLERSEELKQAVARGGGQVLVGFQFRFHPLLNHLREIVRKGHLGVARWAQAHWGQHLPGWHPGEDYRRSYSARADLGGGALLSMCHPFDYLTWIFDGLSCTGVRALRVGGLAVDVEDYADVWLASKHGLIGTAHVNYYERPEEHWLAVGGDLGNLRLDFVRGRLLGSVDELPVEEREPAGFTRNELFVAEMRHFLDVCHGRAQPRCTLDEGLESLRLIVDAKAMAARGRPVPGPVMTSSEVQPLRASEGGMDP
jgi:predicted dehydrogenase